MELDHLRTFVAVAELRHFGRAASACNLSQPAVSHQIAQLERQVGSKLLNRAPRRVSLTAAGEVMLGEARRILAAVDRAAERMREVASGAVGRIRLGATATPGLYSLPPLLARYRDANPGFDLQFTIASSGELVERVVRNELDMALIAGRPATVELRAQRIARDPLVAVGAPSPGSRRRSALALRTLEVPCWILREERSTTRRVVDAWLQRQNAVAAPSMVFDGPDAVKRAAMAGLGIAVVARMTVAEELESGKLVRLEPPLPLPALEFHLIDHPHKHHGPACRAMLRMLSAEFSIRHPALD